MSDLRINYRPELRQPILFAGFAGWNDAGESATSAIRFMRRRWRSEVFADVDPENFYDFTQARPRVRLEKGERVLEWPQNRFYAHRREGEDRDVILLEGIEPHLSWHHYVDAVMGLCRDYNVSGVVILGALLAEASHTRPVRVNGSTQDPWLQEKMSLGPSQSRYEGPTGIVGVLSQTLRDAGIATASLWANVPYYVNATPNPKGSLALLEQLNPAFELGLTLHDLEVFAARFDAQVAGEIAKDPDMVTLARQIDERQDDDDDDSGVMFEPEEDSELPDGASMVEELERFLRQQNRDGD